MLLVSPGLPFVEISIIDLGGFTYFHFGLFTYLMSLLWTPNKHKDRKKLNSNERKCIKETQCYLQTQGVSFSFKHIN